MAYVEGDFPITVGNGSNSGMGAWGGEWLWAIILLALLWGGNGAWGNGGANSGALTRADLCEEMGFNDVSNGIRGISNGICDSTFALNNTITNGFFGVQNALAQGFYGINSGIQAQGYESRLATQTLGSQLASCCCDVRADIQALACQSATETGAIISAGQANTQRIIDYLCNEKIEALRAENTLLTSQLSQNSQTNTIINALRPTPVPAFPASNLYGYYGQNGGCGCGTGYGF